jgi:uncharacterized protein
MKQKYIVWAALVGAVLVMVGTYVFTDTQNEMAYLDVVEKYRTDKHKFFLTSKEAPIKERNGFEGLNYYEPDVAYKVNTRLVLTNDTATYTIEMSDGQQESYVRYAYADFQLKNKPVRLFLFKHEREGTNPKTLFLPFTDLTNGKETYGGGRYLDIDNSKGLQVALDFNLAYNPYCAYNTLYSCPVPPRENHVDMEIPVGEKNFKED